MTWKQRQLSGECAAKCISGSIKHYSSSALVVMATNWEMHRKKEGKKRLLIETLFLHHVNLFSFRNVHFYCTIVGVNDAFAVVLSNSKMSSEQSYKINKAKSCT